MCLFILVILLRKRAARKIRRQNEHKNMHFFPFSFASFTSGYEINPSEIPVEMLDVSGMERITRKAGNASSSSFQRIRDTEFIIKQPTMIKTGEVMDGKDEMA